MYSFILSPKVLVHILHLGNIIKSCFWGPLEDEGPQHDALGRIHSSNDNSTQVKVNLSNTKDKMKNIASTNGEKSRIPISHSYLCDYMLTWDLGKLVVKYVGAYTKRGYKKECVGTQGYY